MEISFDPDKNAVNISKHGLPLAFGAEVIENMIGEVVDTRYAYGERRMKAYAQIDGLWFHCAYTRRGDACHIITVYRVAAREVRRWLGK